MKFSDSNGNDVVTGFAVSDSSCFTGITDITGSNTDTVSMAANNGGGNAVDLGDGLIIVVADGADGVSDTAITDYTSMSDVATFLAGNLTEVTVNLTLLLLTTQLMKMSTHIWSILWQVARLILLMSLIIRSMTLALLN